MSTAAGRVDNRAARSKEDRGSARFRLIREGHELRIVISRPERRNALDPDSMVEMARVIGDAHTDPDIRVIVLTGAGTAFCAGGDLVAVVGQPPETVMEAANALIWAVVASPIPVVAAVNGPAIGYGVALACAADLVYAAREAHFAMPFTSLGLMPDGGSSALVAATVGRARAAELALLGEPISAAEAQAIGLVARAVPGADLDAHVQAVVERLSARPRRAIELTKQALTAASLSAFEDTLDRERSGQGELLATADFAAARVASAGT
ncbi:enoyl-CoA hydratase-related protein [Streptomyces sp. NPDC058320]|uniref:enoyl-CoA hydratase-related protein n=1 Tax=unclassified Streptomyces TaxID=2593676 RepID=UPI003639D0F7